MSDNERFHPGEQRLQREYGSRDNLAQNGHRIIKPYLTEEHQAFFQMLSYVVFACSDKTGRLKSTLLHGNSGFIQVITDKKVMLHLPEQERRLCKQLHVGDNIAMLGIDFNTRRRNRLNGRIQQIEDMSLYIDVEQAFGNCPKYIQQRQLCNTGAASELKHPVSLQQATELSGQMQAIIKQADTCFFASQYPAQTSHQFLTRNISYGIDISHRGGYPGFIQLVDPQTLVIPDYPGNRFFNTLGNLLEDPAATLLLVDFEQGHLLHLAGFAKVHTGPIQADWPRGAERLIEFNLKEAELRLHILPLRWKFKAYSPVLEKLTAQGI